MEIPRTTYKIRRNPTVAIRYAKPMPDAGKEIEVDFKLNIKA